VSRPGTARLRALRLVGFKSFAERTALEFGPGISAIVGPNGSGKSNLADALRWALGEQGRSLRTRKAEDVIFAGSATRQATGMADVTLVIDNEDGLLPVDYTEVDLGRRLYRSGENEYLLNRQRVRLRDLVELLDAANLADNAFLFIGQGMVDQALSLRPEERRPLFEEVAGVRRHERRRRRAEAQLVEADGNLARVRDILSELRPQARRLAAQAEQQAARRDAARELADALVAAGHERWLAASTAAETAARSLVGARADMDRALGMLRDREERVTALVAQLDAHAEGERIARSELDSARVRATELRLTEARAHAELASARRQIERLRSERDASDQRRADARRLIALPLPDADSAGEAALADVEEQLRSVQDSATAAPDDRGSARRIEQARTSLADSEREIGPLRERLEEANRLRDAARDRARVAAREAAAATEAQSAAETGAEDARLALEATEGTRRTAAERAAALATEVSALRARLAALEETLTRGASRELHAAARERGGVPVLDGVDVPHEATPIVEAALGAALNGISFDDAAVPELKGPRGTLVLRGAGGPSEDAADLVDDARRAGGGRVRDLQRRDPRGVATRLVNRAVWVPTLESAIAIRHGAPAGWRIVTTSGAVVTREGIVELLLPAGELERRNERQEVAQTVARAESAHQQATGVSEQASRALDAEQERLRAARRTLDEARAALRTAEERERAAGRELERAERDAAWLAHELERSETAGTRLREELHELERDIDARGESALPNAAGSVSPEYVSDLERRRARLATHLGRIADARREAEEQRRRAEVALAMEDARLAEIEGDLARSEAGEASLAAAVVRLAGDVAAARELERRSEESVRAGEAVEARERAALTDLERDVAAARERLRVAEDATRSAERDELEAQLHLETVREQLLVELAGLGPPAVAALEAVAARDPVGGTGSNGGAQAPAVGSPGEARPAGAPPALDASEGTDESGESEETRRLERALNGAITTWRAATARDERAALPTDLTRLNALRRRYQQLGATNPFAVEEYAELKQRLEGLEAEREDLESAIAATRKLIADLTALMADRFQTTFHTLEGAFARQFEQLFGGGDARLELTDPEDLSATGIEILARPPGKKRQALAMLSGGERALTAVALLFAMLEVHPVPFCVLDEVDAALDEANISRFVAALRRLSEQIQFIVITHNRGTIEAADALYGVTIGDDAISRVISLRLAPATQLPERESRERAHATA
jgi:chromosome segregation protein